MTDDQPTQNERLLWAIDAIRRADMLTVQKPNDWEGDAYQAVQEAAQLLLDYQLAYEADTGAKP